MYNFPELVLLPWMLFSTTDFSEWNYLEITLTSFLDLAGRGGSDGTLLIVTGTSFAISFLLLLLGRFVRCSSHLRMKVYGVGSDMHKV